MAWIGFCNLPTYVGLYKLRNNTFYNLLPLRYQKIKIDKTKLLNLLNTKKSTFDSLHKKMEKIVPTLESGKTDCITLAENVYRILVIL